MRKYLEDIPKSTWGRWEVKSIRHSYGFFNGNEVDGKHITSLLYRIGLDEIDFKTVVMMIEKAIEGCDLKDIDDFAIQIGTTYEGKDIEVVGRVEYSAELKQVIDDDATVSLYFDVGEVSSKDQWNFGFILEIETKVNSTFDLSLVENKENKTMKKSIKEKFEAPKDWDFEEMISDYGMEYLGESNPDLEPFPMDEFNELTNYRDDPLEAITRAFFGGRYGFKNDSFSPMDEYFAYNGYGNLISIKDYDIEEYLKDHIDESYFYDWCVDNGYFEVEEDE